MNISQKLAALNILRNAGRIASEIGRKAAALEILGHVMLADRLVKIADRLEFEDAEITRLSVGLTTFPDVPEGYEFPAELVVAESNHRELRDTMQSINAEIASIADALEREIDAENPAAVALDQESRVVA
jgi:hypothetical protein